MFYYTLLCSIIHSIEDAHAHGRRRWVVRHLDALKAALRRPALNGQVAQEDEVNGVDHAHVFHLGKGDLDGIQRHPSVSRAHALELEDVVLQEARVQPDPFLLKRPAKANKGQNVLPAGERHQGHLFTRGVDARAHHGFLDAKNGVAVFEHIDRGVFGGIDRVGFYNVASNRVHERSSLQSTGAYARLPNV